MGAPITSGTRAKLGSKKKKWTGNVASELFPPRRRIPCRTRDSRIPGKTLPWMTHPDTADFLP